MKQPEQIHNEAIYRKECSHCGENKALSEFVERGNGYRGTCKACHQANMQKRRDTAKGEKVTAMSDALDVFFGDKAPPPAAPEVTDLFPELDMSEDEARRKTDLIKEYEQRTVGLLLEIRDRKGWRALGYQSWEEYGAKEFRYTTDYLNKLISAEVVNRNLRNTIGIPTPLPERQTRELASIHDEELQAKVYRRAEEISDSKERYGKAALFHKQGKISAADIRAAREELLPSDTPRFIKTEAEESPMLPQAAPYALLGFTGFSIEQEGRIVLFHACDVNGAAVAVPVRRETVREAAR